MSTPRRILIISDQPHIRAVVAKVLQLAPGSYREAEGVPHAIPLLSAKHEPTLVLVDALDGAPGSQVGHDILPLLTQEDELVVLPVILAERDDGSVRKEVPEHHESLRRLRERLAHGEPVTALKAPAARRKGA